MGYVYSNLPASLKGLYWKRLTLSVILCAIPGNSQIEYKRMFDHFIEFFSFVLDAFLSNEFDSSSTQALTYWMKKDMEIKVPR